MNRHAWTATALFRGLLLLVLVLPCAFAAAQEAADEAAGATADTDAGETSGRVPTWTDEKKPGPRMSSEARIIGDPDHPDPPAEGSFRPGPSYDDHVYSAEAQLQIYRQQTVGEDGETLPGKHLVPTAKPPIELGRRLYDRGSYKPSATWLGEKNPLTSHFMVYGDLRVGAAYNDNGVAGANGETYQSTVAARLNLDIDWKLTATERIHAFVRPIDTDGAFTRYEIDGKIEDEGFDELDFNLETLYFEGDIGAISRGWSGEAKKYDLPFAFGLVPIFTQNGIWINDAMVGVAFALTAKNSPTADISNFDFTFFAGFDKVTSGAVANDEDANLFGMASFMDLRQGYLEFGYGYVDAEIGDLSYHNVTVAYSKRYWGKVSNSIRLIGNFGQDPVSGQAKTADGVLVLLENSLISHKPSTLIPYFNFFAGFDTPQALARDAGVGGVLVNTGINFETDGLTGFPTLDASGHESYGGAVGVEYLFGLKRQIIVEGAVVERMSDSLLGSEYALGIRFQEPLNNAWILRLDAMAGWRDGREDILGARIEIRRKL